MILSDDYFDINYDFLKKRFFAVKDNNKISNIYDSLNDTQKKLMTKNAIKLYEYGNFILNFLNNFDFRKFVATEILTERLKTKNDDVIRNTVNQPNIIKNDGNKMEWSVVIL